MKGDPQRVPFLFAVHIAHRDPPTGCPRPPGAPVHFSLLAGKRILCIALFLCGIFLKFSNPNAYRTSGRTPIMLHEPVGAPMKARFHETWAFVPQCCSSRYTLVPTGSPAAKPGVSLRSLLQTQTRQRSGLSHIRER